MEMLFALFGGLAMFLYGMDRMSRALQRAAGDAMKRLLARLTATPLLGVLTGLAVTAVLQSSSAATVMVIGFVSAGLLELPRAVAVIYGINIGTTMTAQLIAFDVQTLVYPVLFLGFLLDFAARRPRWQAVGEAVFSFGLLFEGIDILGRALQPLAGQAVFLDWMTRVKESPLLGILLGLSMTMVVQSSSATIALLQNVARQAGPDGIHSVLGLAGAVPVLLGDNIGTTVTALLACIGQGKDAARAALAQHWDTLLSTYHLESGEEKLDRMVNLWHQYQCMVTFNMSRSASYFESGTGRGMGFRDSCQDLLGFVHIIPSRARERILDIAATQFEDGSAYHQYQPLTKKGNRDIGTGFNDDPLWLIAGTAAYLRETGDWSILDEQVPFDNDASKAQSLMEHLRRSFNFTVTHLGPHGLPLIGRADWNDCLNLNCFSEHPGESFQITGPSEGPVAESVFIAGMFVKYGHEYAELCDHLNLADEAAAARKAVDGVEQAALTSGWDGAWFRRAYDAFGKPVGSKECTEGQIFIEPQGMCVMAGIGKETGQAAQALKSVEERLDTKYGVVLHQPAYTSYQLNLGEISSYPPGYKENAGIFCHNNPWISCAEAVLGHGDRAFEVYRKTCPAYIEDISEIHRTEPYVYSQMVAGKDAPTFGEAKNSWLTGTAAWTFFNVSQYILGIQPTLDGLKVDPCIPHTLGGFTVTRRYRGATYHIAVDNTAAVQYGVKSVAVDGKPIEGSLLPLAPEGAVVEVQVTMG